MAELTVDEAAAAYVSVMRNVAPSGAGVCDVCHTFIDPAYSLCYRCDHQPNELDAVAPIAYSEHLGQMHLALRNYKDGVRQAQHYAMPRLAAILWKFLERHETCVGREAGAASGRFDVVTTVPSSTPDRDEQRGNLRWIVGVACAPVRDRYRRVIRATGQAQQGRAYDSRRYEADELAGASVLLIDDTWTAGGHAQSAASALRAAGARRVALVVIGRHIHREYQLGSDETNADRLDALPRQFDWDVCALH